MFQMSRFYFEWRRWLVKNVILLKCWVDQCQEMLTWPLLPISSQFFPWSMVHVSWCFALMIESGWGTCRNWLCIGRGKCMVLETNMGKTAKLRGHGIQLTKIGRSFINRRALGLKRQGQIFDGMVTRHATQEVKRENHTWWPTAAVLAIHDHAFCFHQGFVHFTAIVDQHLWKRQDFGWANKCIMGENHVNTTTARSVGGDIDSAHLWSVGFAVDKLFDPRIGPAMGSVGTDDDPAGQRIVSLKVLVDGFFRGCCHRAWSWTSQNATTNGWMFPSGSRPIV